MSEKDLFLTKVQFAVYLAEVAVLSGMLALAAAASPEFALDPITRILAAAALPLPCHLLLMAHVACTGRADRPRLVKPVVASRPRLLPASVETIWEWNGA